ncbi:hypothetical protein LL912_15840 [Niabella sp. CC-SYL272]|uniref:hypothetical protein n=1 Tax=Niabella agricola TaxID=2891571 RepID=UPI001F381DBA|nr:hypothetical protein [Niabella agricola]MCF3110256.1 hypothetical protein [Niabella agricola]
MTKDEFLTANQAEQLKVIKTAKVIWEKKEEHRIMTLYKLSGLYIQACVSKMEQTIQFDCFGNQ